MICWEKPRNKITSGRLELQRDTISIYQVALSRKNKGRPQERSKDAMLDGNFGKMVEIRGIRTKYHFLGLGLKRCQDGPLLRSWCWAWKKLSFFMSNRICRAKSSLRCDFHDTVNHRNRTFIVWVRSNLMDIIPR